MLIQKYKLSRNLRCQVCNPSVITQLTVVSLDRLNMITAAAMITPSTKIPAVTPSPIPTALL